MAVSKASDLVWYLDRMHKVLGVREFQIAEALMEGRVDLLSEPVESQHGRTSLYELCHYCGCFDTAGKMIAKGVPGCRVELHHLKRVFSKKWPWGVLSCSCKACDRTCRHCCFGFPVNEGIWMQDWASLTDDAAAAAHSTAQQPFVGQILKALRLGTCPLGDISEEAMVHLLDIAILIGDKEVATRLAQHSRLRPLRRWRSEEMFICSEHQPLAYDYGYCLIPSLSVTGASAVLLAVAALSGGAQLQRLQVPVHSDCIGSDFLSIAQALVLCERWWEFTDLTEILQVQEPQYQLYVVSVSLLDVAICLRQFDCAAFCCAVGVRLTKDFIESARKRKGFCWNEVARACQSESDLLRRRDLCAKGIAIYQMFSYFEGKPRFRKWLVEEVVAFARDSDVVDHLLELGRVDKTSVRTGHSPPPSLPVDEFDDADAPAAEGVEGTGQAMEPFDRPETIAKSDENLS